MHQTVFLTHKSTFFITIFFSLFLFYFLNKFSCKINNTSKYEFFSILKFSAIFDVGLKTPGPVELILIYFSIF